MPKQPEPDPNEAAEPTEVINIAEITEATEAIEATETFAAIESIESAETAQPTAAAEPNPDEQVTEVITTDPAPAPEAQPERRFTAPGFDASKTEVMPTLTEQATEMITAQPGVEAGKAAPRQISARFGGRLPATTPRSWGWVMALILIILALAVVAVLGTLWLTRDSRAQASQEERVRDTVQSFDVAVQNGDLASLRSLTCGDIRDRYDNYDQRAWNDTYSRIAAAKQYPVIASIDQVVVNDGQAEVNVTAFMAYEPRTRSTRSLDLQYRDDQWKICQARS
ncbi:hypothetical protein KIH27_02830 [Mycobacterium sp. M1]|uniref:DUF4878 domain-containing protein n=1 Tax=Mycolicibacter acidiphilus TaxID=2835306 RepID=A0ABS5RE07_9MYCO|nr:hypothetical protein [Mycolicibacter acidiphilus]MBS9532518.1 hypothetical protein [Mycolicibacter acidiphilus]